MHRIDGAGATNDNKFTLGSPSQGIPATTVTADWCNDLQEEIVSVIASQGISLVKGTQNQLYSAISNMVSKFAGKRVSLNEGGAASSGGDVGFDIVENAIVTGTFRSSSDRTAFRIKMPARAGYVDLAPSAGAFTTRLEFPSTADRTITFPDATGTLTTTAAVAAQFALTTGLHGITGSFVGTTDAQTLTNKRVSSTAAMTGAFELPAGTVAQRPTAIPGYVRLNTDSNEFEGYAAGAWQALGSGGATGLNEKSLKNYLKPYATGSAAVGTVTTLANPGDPITSTLANFHVSSGSTIAQSVDSSLRGGANYLTGFSGASISGTTFIQFPALALETMDLGTAIVEAFDMLPVNVDGELDAVIVRYNSTGVFQELLALGGNASSGVFKSAKLPSGRYPFKSFFMANAQPNDLYALRVRRLSGVNHNVRLDALFRGPESLVNVAPITDSKSFTPVIYGSTVNPQPSMSGKCRQDGEDLIMEVWFSLGGTGFGSGTYTALVPFGLQIDYSKMAKNSSVDHGVGRGNGYCATNNGSTRFGLVPGFVSSSPNQVFLYKTNGTALSSGDMVANADVYFSTRVPIVGWSSNVTSFDSSPAQEFVFNSSTTAASDTTSFGYGTSGAVCQPFAPTGVSNVVKRVRFQTPFQVTDRIIIEFTSQGQWVPLSDSFYGFVTNDAGTTYYGVYGRYVSGSMTDYEVTFHSQPYATGGWNNENSAGIRWRVRKISGGTQTVFPVSARNIFGDTSGSVVPAGLLGESIVFTARATPGAVGGVSSNAAILATLSAGVWIVHAYAIFSAATTGSLVAYYVATNGVWDFTGVIAEGGFAYNNVSAASNNVFQPMVPRQPVVVGPSGQALYAKSFSEDAAIPVTIGGFAVRIA